MKTRKSLENRITPVPIDKKKDHILALYELKEEIKNGSKRWYLMRIQKENFKAREWHLINVKHKGARKIQEWKNISHSVDVANSLKKQLRNKGVHARQNLIRSQNLKSEQIVLMIDAIIEECRNEINQDNRPSQRSILGSTQIMYNFLKRDRQRLMDAMEQDEGPSISKPDLV